DAVFVEAQLDATSDQSNGMAMLLGNTGEMSVGGIATFQNLRVTWPGSGYRLVLSTPGFPNVVAQVTDPFSLEARPELLTTFLDDRDNNLEPSSGDFLYLVFDSTIDAAFLPFANTTGLIDMAFGGGASFGSGAVLEAFTLASYPELTPPGVPATATVLRISVTTGE